MIGQFMKRIVLMFAGIMVLATMVFGDEGFPLRKKYPTLKPITTKELYSAYDNVSIVDVRSKLEYDVIHINNALHLPVTVKTFVKDLEKARSKTATKPLVFYCNGHTCEKSYEAAEIAIKAGFGKVLVYDSGIFEWVSAFPAKTTLMGKTPATASKLIPKIDFSDKCLNKTSFMQKSKDPTAVVIDIREPFQRKFIPQIKGLKNIPSDRMIDVLNSKQMQEKELLFIDAVGKQVEWLQYYLQANGYKNYFFLEKGVKSLEGK